MPDLRIVTWNSGGEAGGRGAELVNATATINGSYPALPIQLVAIQEANVGGGSIQNALAQQAPFQNEFAQPPGLSREHTPIGTPAPNAQPFRIMPSKAYLTSWMNRGAGPFPNLAAAFPNPQLVPLSHADQGVHAYILGLRLNLQTYHYFLDVAGSIRWPIYQQFSFAGQNAGPTIHFFSWHAPLAANWLGADILMPHQGPGLPAAFMFLQASTFYTQIAANLGPSDLILIAGDLNLLQQDLHMPGIFDHFVGVSSNLSHIIAHGRGQITVDQNHAFNTPYPPHAILTARVRW